MREASVHLTLKPAAQELGVHQQTLRAWEKRGLIRMVRLPGSRYRRVPVEEVERLKCEMGSMQAASNARSAQSAQDPEASASASALAETVLAELPGIARSGERSNWPLCSLSAWRSSGCCQSCSRPAQGSSWRFTTAAWWTLTPMKVSRPGG